MTLADFSLPKPLRRVLVAMAKVACPPDIEDLGLAEEVADETAEYLRALPAYVRAALVAGLTAFEASAMVLPGSFGRPFSYLPRERALAHFERYWSSKVMVLHELAFSVRALLVAAYYEHPVVRQRMGFTPEGWIAEVKAHRDATYLADVRRHEEVLRAPDPLVPRTPQSDAERKVDDAR